MKKLKQILQYNYLFLGIFTFLIFYVFVMTKLITYQSKYNIEDTILEGKIINYSINGDNLKMAIKGKELVKTNYYIKTEEEKKWLLKSIHLGTWIHLEGEFKEPIHNTIPNTFDYKKYLYQHKIFYTFTISTYELNQKNNPFYKIKDWLLKRVYQMEENEYILIFLLGDKSLVATEEYEGFQMNGTAHLLAISGMHIGILVNILNILLQKLNEKKKTIIIIIILFFFAFLTGFSASVLRVILFFTLMAWNKEKEKNYSNLQILFFTGAILTLYNPFIIYDYGFLYSMIITAGILYYSEKLKGKYWIQLFKLSCITFLFSLPITASLNYEINLISILANLIFVPFVTFIVYPLALITIFFPNPFWKIVVRSFISLNSCFQNLSLNINIPKMPIILITSFYIGLICFKKKKQWLLVLLFILIINKVLPKIDNQYSIYYIDIGQGDCAVLISPHQKEVLMIDTGGKVTYTKDVWATSNKTYNVSDNTIKFLKSLGVTTIDYLILSHGEV